MITKNWVFFDASSTSATSTELGLRPEDGCIKVDVALITAGTSFSVKFQELDDLSGSDWHDISAVNMGTFETGANITSAGSYLVVLPGAQKVRAVLSNASQAGKVKVYGNIIA